MSHRFIIPGKQQNYRSGICLRRYWYTH